MSYGMSTLKKISNTRLQFKSKQGYFTLKEFRITENSGYALFVNKDEELYFTVINTEGRRFVATELVSTILRAVFWTSIIDIGRADTKKPKR